MRKPYHPRIPSTKQYTSQSLDIKITTGNELSPDTRFIRLQTKNSFWENPMFIMYQGTLNQCAWEIKYNQQLLPSTLWLLIYAKTWISASWNRYPNSPPTPLSKVARILTYRTLDEGNVKIWPSPAFGVE